jgi:hypothetical protein
VDQRLSDRGRSIAEYGAGRDHGVAARLFSMHEYGGFVMLPAGTNPTDQA